MSSMCGKLQAKLAAGGPGALREDPKGQHHLEECEECFAVLESLAQLDEALAELPPVDVSDAVVAQLLARPELLLPGSKEKTSPRRFLQPWLARLSGLGKLDPFVLRTAASMAVVVLAVGLAFMVRLLAPGHQSAPMSSAPMSLEHAPAAGEFSNGETPEAPATELDAETTEKLRSLGYVTGDGSYGEGDDAEARLKSEATALPESETETMVGGRQRSERAAQKRGDLLDQIAPTSSADMDQPAIVLEEGFATQEKMVFKDSMVLEGKVLASRPPAADGKPAEPAWVGTEADITFRGGSPRVESKSKGAFESPLQEETVQRLRKRLNELPRGLGDRREANREGEDPVNRETANREIASGEKAHRKQDKAKKEVSRDLDESSVELEEMTFEPEPVRPSEAPALASAHRLAEVFLQERARLDGVHSQPAEGYWANTYVPGDPALRHLQASLLRRDRAALEVFTPTPLELHDAVRQPTQPFDLPESAALAVYLQADRAALEGRRRLLLQVGLQASERLGGRRPAMNLGVVLDLRGEIPTSSATTFRALLTAFAQTRDLGDRFRLFVAGRAGGEVVGPESFHHGPVAVTLDRLLTSAEAEGATMSLAEALTNAAEAVSRDDDPSSPLGSSAVILVTDQPLGEEGAALGRLAHRRALEGVTVSVIGVGEGVEVNELENLALAGQGHRRLLHLPGEASAVVERELAAVGRAVARAVRLRIRLAPGVELIDVLGSHRLDVASAERVRQAEQSIDRRLSKNLGITADRGEDEDGLQIIIPSFYAGDSHVVLLDVVAPGPGPIADVRVRYKDLVYFENGVARGRLTLDRGIRPAGPLERNVFKNLLATDARGVFEDAGQLLQAGDSAAARERLETFRQLLLGLGEVLPDLAKDRDLERDIALLGEYITLLEAGAAAGEARSHLVDSLRFSGRLKILPRPAASGDL